VKAQVFLLVQSCLANTKYTYKQNMAHFFQKEKKCAIKVRKKFILKKSAPVAGAKILF